MWGAEVKVGPQCFAGNASRALDCDHAISWNTVAPLSNCCMGNAKIARQLSAGAALC
jgi:hypothetical protein